MADDEDRDNDTNPAAPFDPTADLRVFQSESPHTPEQIAALTALNQAAEDYFAFDGIDLKKLDVMAEARDKCTRMGIDYGTSQRVIRRAYNRSVAK